MVNDTIDAGMEKFHPVYIQGRKISVRIRGQYPTFPFMEELSFGADKVRVTGPMADGSYKVSFYTGEYQQVEVAQMVAIPQGTMLKVTVSDYDKG